MLVLDTHAWVWFVLGSPQMRRETAAALLAASGHRLFLVPAICLWEVALLAERGRLDLFQPTGSWVRSALDPQQFEVAPLTPDIAIAGARLPSRDLTDPADRMIVATALESGLPLATRDAKIIAFAETSDLRVMPI